MLATETKTICTGYKQVGLTGATHIKLKSSTYPRKVVTMEPPNKKPLYCPANIVMFIKHWMVLTCEVMQLCCTSKGGYTRSFCDV